MSKNEETIEHQVARHLAQIDSTRTLLAHVISSHCRVDWEAVLEDARDKFCAWDELKEIYDQAFERLYAEKLEQFYAEKLAEAQAAREPTP